MFPSQVFCKVDQPKRTCFHIMATAKQIETIPHNTGRLWQCALKLSCHSITSSVYYARYWAGRSLTNHGTLEIGVRGEYISLIIARMRKNREKTLQSNYDRSLTVAEQIVHFPHLTQRIKKNSF